MAAIRWLHLTDLHQGLAGQQWLWPTVKDAFFRDLDALHQKSGPWDLVLFTGDLSQSGDPDQFKRLGDTLDRLWVHLRALGSDPALVMVPGNHDLVRPKSGAALRALSHWHDDADLRNDFWASPANEYHALLRTAFAPYEAFAASRPLPATFTVQHGLLPGDVSVSVTRDGMSVALVGLNSTFLQLAGGDYLGRLELDPRQLHAVTDPDDPTGWIRKHDLALLLTHHPTAWLHPRSREGFLENVAPAGLFFAHLFGHMHEGTSSSVSVGGAALQRAVQGPSLFGLETWGDGTAQRIHGYMAAKVEIVDRKGTFTLWPRVSMKTKAGVRQIAPDYEFTLDADGAITERFEARRPVVSPAKPPTADRVAPPAVPVQPVAVSAPLDEATLVRELRGLLAALYPSSLDIARVVEDAGIERARVEFNGSAQTIWFSVLQEASKSGRLGALVKVARDDYPHHPDVLRLAGAAPPPSAAHGTAPSEASPGVLYDALGRLLTSQFEEVLFRMAIQARFLPAPTSPQSERALALVRLVEQAGRFADLRAAIEQVGGRVPAGS